MISTGAPTTTSATKTTEVIDLEDSNVICGDLEDFSLETEGAVGANVASTPIICGGLVQNYYPINSSDKCFKYAKGGWQNLTNMIESRYRAAGIVYNNALHIFGGQSYPISTILQSSEIVNQDGSSSEGPQLPSPISSHAIASINSSVSIITGGRTNNNSYSDKTWYFNHASQEFQPGPNLLEGRCSHSSGTVTDQVTKEKTAIIVGGLKNSNDYLDSTEMLLNGEWKTGKNHRESYTYLFILLYL